LDPSDPAAWHDLAVGLVGAGAALAGLTFVAVALNPHQIERTEFLRLRAASALTSFVGVVMIGIAILVPRPMGSFTALLSGVAALVAAARLIASTIRQDTWRRPQRGASRMRGAATVLSFLLATAGSFALAVIQNGWVYLTLTIATVLMLASGIYASWLLVLQVGVPENESPQAVPPRR
jgi:small-conductance mechanosensitive channel